MVFIFEIKELNLSKKINLTVYKKYENTVEGIPITETVLSVEFQYGDLSTSSRSRHGPSVSFTVMPMFAVPHFSNVYKKDGGWSGLS